MVVTMRYTDNIKATCDGDVDEFLFCLLLNVVRYKNTHEKSSEEVGESLEIVSTIGILLQYWIS